MLQTYMKLREVARRRYVDIILENNAIWRYGLNLGPTRRYRRAKPQLSSEAQRVVGDLNSVGAAQTTLEALTGDGLLLKRLQDESRRLERFRHDEIEEKRANLRSVERLGNGSTDKDFLVTMLNPHRPVIDPTGVFARVVLDRQVKGIADSYFEMQTLVADTNIWMNLPSDRDPAASQLWHRDMRDDHFIFKMFVYLEDVGSGCGPFSYIKGTHRKGHNYSWSPPTHWDGYNLRATDSDVAATTNPDDVLEFPAPAGTVLFADTGGWHKGGRATEQRRLVMQSTFSSRVALPDRQLALPEGVRYDSAPGELRYSRRAS